MHTHHSSTSASQPAPAQPFSHLSLFTLTAGLIGIQFCWAVQIGYVTKSLLELGLPNRFVSYAWLAGPIAGILVQPIVGLHSDRCTSRFGRRRPFLFAGSLLAMLCLLLFAYAEPIGRLLGDPPSDPERLSVKTRALVVAISSFWALDFAINAAQGPLRALLADVVPPHQHKVGNAYFALATGIGNFSGSLLGSLRLSSVLFFFPGDLQALYTIAALMLALTMGTTIFCTREIPMSPTNSVRSNPSYQATPAPERIGFLQSARTAPPPFWPVFIVQCFAWFGWFTLFVFGTSWVGAEVYNGSYEAPEGTDSRDLYDAGVRLGNLGLSLQSVVTIVVAPLLPTMIRRTSSQLVYVASYLMLAVALVSALVITHAWQAWIAVTAIATTGFAWAVTMTIPWALMGEAVAKLAPERAGVYYTMFNLSQCFPEVVVSLVAEEVERVTNRQAAMLGLGGGAVFLAAALVVVLRIGAGGGTAPDEEALTNPLGADDDELSTS